MSIYTPYTYLIGWSTHNKWYYGVRYAKNCNPSDLCKTYFTSSKHIKQFRKEYGDPDIIQIRKKFNDVEKAILWEHKVLKRLKVNITEKWINQTYNGCFVYKGEKNTIPGSIAAAKRITGKTYEEISGKEIAEKRKNRCIETGKKVWEDPELRIRMSKKPENTSKYKEAALKRWSDPLDREKRCKNMKGSKQRKRQIFPSENGSIEEKSINRSDSLCISSLSAAGTRSFNEEPSRIK